MNESICNIHKKINEVMQNISMYLTFSLYINIIMFRKKNQNCHKKFYIQPKFFR